MTKINWRPGTSVDFKNYEVWKWQPALTGGKDYSLGKTHDMC